MRDYSMSRPLLSHCKTKWHFPRSAGLAGTPEAKHLRVFLLRLGHEVDFPLDQACCGQMHSIPDFKEPLDDAGRTIGSSNRGNKASVSRKEFTPAIWSPASSRTIRAQALFRPSGWGQYWSYWGEPQ